MIPGDRVVASGIAKGKALVEQAGTVFVVLSCFYDTVYYLGRQKIGFSTIKSLATGKTYTTETFNIELEQNQKI